MKAKHSCHIFFLSLLIVSSYGCGSSPVGKKRDLGQMIADQEGSHGVLEETLKHIPADEGLHASGGLQGDRPLDHAKDSDTGRYAIPFDDREETLDQIIETRGRGSGFQVMGATEGPAGEYQSFDTVELVRDNFGRHRSSFTLSYISDTFDYEDSRGVFERTYELSSRAAKNGFVMFNWNSRIFNTHYIQPFWLINVGLGHNMGKGEFIDGEPSDATFTLWMLPIDIGLGLDIPIGSWFKIGASGGVSGMGLIQNRSDIDSTEGENTRRQASYGHFYEMQLKFNLARMFTRSAQSLYYGQDVTSYYLALKMRGHTYENFLEEDFRISGQSIGIGLSFEFL